MRFLLVALLAACGPKPSPAPTTSPPITAEPVAPGVCPSRAPVTGAPCGRQLDQCSYPDEPRCPTTFCADQASKLVWQTSYDQCPIACPAAKPSAGSPCSPVTFQSCTYKVGDKCGFQMHCAQGGWVERELTLCDGM